MEVRVQHEEVQSPRVQPQRCSATTTLDSDKLEVVKEHKYLGVWLDEKENSQGVRFNQSQEESLYYLRL